MQFEIIYTFLLKLYYLIEFSSLMTMRPTSRRQLLIKTITICAWTVCVEGVNSADHSLTIIINAEFLSGPLRVGDTISFRPPWTNLTVKGRDVIVGITEVELVDSASSTRNTQIEPGEDSNRVCQGLKYYKPPPSI